MSTEAIAILGAGNAGRAMAAYLTLRGYPVKLYNRWDSEIEDIKDGAIQVSGWSDQRVQIGLVTTDIAAGLEGCGIVFLVVPAFAHRFLAESAAPHLRDGQVVVVHPGIVGGALAVRHVLDRAAPGVAVTVAETITSIFASRLRPGGVHIRQVLTNVAVGVVPSRETARVLDRLAGPFEGRLVAAGNVLETSLNNRNPIYHCPTMLANVGRSEAGEAWPFANVVTPGVIRLIEAVDAERCAMAEALGVTAVSYYESLRRRLGRDEGDLASQIRAVFLPGGASPLPTSLSHRYVSEDVPFGLLPWISLGEWAGLAMPVMRSVATALSAASGTDHGRAALSLADLGITAADTPRSWVARL